MPAAISATTRRCCALAATILVALGVAPAVALGQVTITTQSSPSAILLGDSFSDSALVLGRVNPQAVGSIPFRLYGPSDSACIGIPVFQTSHPRPATDTAVFS